ncbi:MAG TPA: hypothetical protein VFA48_09235 [Gammaproteobacteria bacterium]|nr:hypothetical protein [Gammaproteobacteria bacterium]
MCPELGERFGAACIVDESRQNARAGRRHEDIATLGIPGLDEGVAQDAVPSQLWYAPASGASVLALDLMVLKAFRLFQREFGTVTFRARGFDTYRFGFLGQHLA